MDPATLKGPASTCVTVSTVGIPPWMRWPAPAPPHAANPFVDGSEPTRNVALDRRRDRRQFEFNRRRKPRWCRQRRRPVGHHRRLLARQHPPNCTKQRLIRLRIARRSIVIFSFPTGPVVVGWRGRLSPGAGSCQRVVGEKYREAFSGNGVAGDPVAVDEGPLPRGTRLGFPRRRRNAIHSRITVRWPLDDHGNAACMPNYGRAVGPILSRGHLVPSRDGCDRRRPRPTPCPCRVGRSMVNSADWPRTGLLLSRALRQERKGRALRRRLTGEPDVHASAGSLVLSAGDRRCSGRRRPCTPLSIACVIPYCSFLPIACSCSSPGG
jgi:hypothetical protein